MHHLKGYAIFKNRRCVGHGSIPCRQIILSLPGKEISVSEGAPSQRRKIGTLDGGSPEPPKNCLHLKSAGAEPLPYNFSSGKSLILPAKEG